LGGLAAAVQDEYKQSGVDDGVVDEVKRQAKAQSFDGVPRPTDEGSRIADDLAVALALADLADSIIADRFQAADLVVTSKPDLTKPESV